MPQLLDHDLSCMPPGRSWVTGIRFLGLKRLVRSIDALFTVVQFTVQLVRALPCPSAMVLSAVLIRIEILIHLASEEGMITDDHFDPGNT
eukprot:1161833-Pelagomonas_calceolata.AAC.13